MNLDRSDILPEGNLPDASDLLARGRAAAKDYPVGCNPFLKLHVVKCEAEFKRRCATDRRIMQHAQVGFRDFDKSCRAYAKIYESCQAKNVTVDRYGLCLDWSMGYPADRRDNRPKGTGLLLRNIEEFVR